MTTVDIVIPAYNNAHSLPAVLQAINNQEIPEGWRVCVYVCDDGSTDATAEIVAHENHTFRHRLLHLPAPHHGAAAARNRGILAGSGDVIVLLGADIILRAGALAAHFAFHHQYPNKWAAALGFVVWDPRVKPTPLMEWMIHGGPQNDFDSLLGKSAQIPFYGSHVSLKRSALSGVLFSEDYEGYGWEDIEFGDRLKQRGLHLRPLHAAVGLHQHFYSAEDVFSRQYAVGISHHIFGAHTGNPLPKITIRHRVQQMLYPLGIGAGLRSLVQFLASRYATPRLFAHVANYEYRRGLFHSPSSSYPQGFTQ